MLFRLEVMQNTNERFIMRLYESHTTPHTYAVHLRFHTSRKKAALSPSIAALGIMRDEGKTVAHVGSDWSTAFKTFEETFLKLTGLKWEERGDRERAGAVRTVGYEQ